MRTLLPVGTEPWGRGASFSVVPFVDHDIVNDVRRILSLRKA